MRRNPWAGFRYDFQRTLTRALALIIVVVVIIVALATAAEIPTNPVIPRMYSGVLFYSDGAYHFDFYAFNEYGTPLQGIDYSVVVTSRPGNATLATLGGRTAANGSVEFSVALSGGPFNAAVEAGPQGFGPFAPAYWTQGASRGNVSFGTLTPGEIVPILSPITAALNLPTGFSGELALQVYYPALDASCGSGCSVYYALVNVDQGVTPLAASSMVRLGSLSSSPQAYPLAIPPTNETNLLNVQVEIFSTSGSLIATDANSTASSFDPYVTPDTVGDGAFSTYFGYDMIFLIPLLAIVAAFSFYARDRLSGVLESTIVQPVTRLGLATSRFLGALIVLLAAVGAGTLLTDALILLRVGYTAAPSYMLSYYLGFAVFAFSFVGVVFLMSHLVRTVAPLFAVALGLYLFFSVFWNGLVTALEAPSQAYYVASRAGLQLQVQASFLNPIQYPSLFLAGLTNTTPGIGAQYGGDAASWEVTPIVLGLTALAWLLIPFLLLQWRILTRD